jgi:predicted Zn-dependent peptidase
LYQKTVLQNGIRIVTEKIPYFHSVSTGIWVNVGSRDEQESERGITHLIEHMFFKGTEHRSALDIAKQLDAVGGLANAYTSKEQVCLHAKVLDKHLPLVVDILTDIFLNSVFDPSEIDRERQVILQEISMIEDTPDEYVHILLQELFWKDNPLGWPIYGTAAQVQEIGKDNILTYVRRTFHPGRIVIAAAGNVEHQAFVDLVAPRMETLNGCSANLDRHTPKDHHLVKIIPKNLEQVQLCLGWRGCSNLDENRFACHLLNVVLGSSMSSRLFQEVRERRGLAYSIYSFSNSHEDTGMLGVYTGTSMEQVQETLDIIYDELVRLTREPISEAEITAAKEHLTGSMYLNAESTDSRVNRLAKNETLFGRLVPFEEIEEKIEMTSSQSIQEWFRSVFGSQNLATLLFGPVQSDQLNLSRFS